jgi:hypothetical protein
MNTSHRLMGFVTAFTFICITPAFAELSRDHNIAEFGLEAVGRGLYALGIGIGLAGLFIGLGLRKRN